VTLLPPLKRIATLKLSKLSKLSIFAPHAKIPISVEPDPIPPTPSELLEQIGVKLRQLREQHHLSIEDMSLRTQIQPRLIQAIEEGHIEMLPEPVYVRGMVKRYGDSLGLDGVTISQQVPTWESEAATFEPVTRLQTTGFNAPIQVKPLHVYLGYTLAIFGIGAGTSHLLNNAIKPQSKTIGGTVVQPSRAIIAVAPQPLKTQGIQVGIVVINPTWAQIGIDGTTKFTGSLKVGTKFDWIAHKQVTISTNNAGGLLFSQNGQPPQLLGKIGERKGTTIKVGK
jgi:transcriptional regulator with XRE-family HTH domain